MYVFICICIYTRILGLFMAHRETRTNIHIYIYMIFDMTTHIYTHINTHTLGLFVAHRETRAKFVYMYIYIYIYICL
jgi:hypothetical protein